MSSKNALRKMEVDITVLRIAVVSAGVLPVPAVNGGAVESLVDFILRENEIIGTAEFVVFSSYNVNAVLKSATFRRSKFVYIKINKLMQTMHHALGKIAFRVLKTRMNLYSPYIRKICRLIAQQDFDHIIVENRPDYVLSLKEWTSLRVSLHLHNDYLNIDLKNSRAIIDKCHRILTVSDFIRRKALTLGSQYEERLRVLPNCTDIDIFNKGAYEDFRNSFRDAHYIKENDVVFLFSGRLHPSKGVKELILAFSMVKSDRCKLLVVGGSWYGSNSTTPFEEEIRSISSEMKDRIMFTGFVPFSDIPKFHAVADAAVVPSVWEEPAGLVLIEAMSSGLPTIVTNVGGITEYANQSTSIILSRDDKLIDKLGEAIEFLATDVNQREVMGRAAMEVAQKFNTKRYYHQFIACLEDSYEN